MADIKNKQELASNIFHSLQDEGLIILNYGQEFYKEGEEDCINEIKRILENYLVVEGGRVIE